MTRIEDIHWLSDDNADRTCNEDCRESAEAYLQTEDESTRFICERHLRRLL